MLYAVCGRWHTEAGECHGNENAQLRTSEATREYDANLRVTVYIMLVLLETSWKRIYFRMRRIEIVCTRDTRKTEAIRERSRGNERRTKGIDGRKRSRTRRHEGRWCAGWSRRVEVKDELENDGKAEGWLRQLKNTQLTSDDLKNGCRVIAGYFVRHYVLC